MQGFADGAPRDAPPKKSPNLSRARDSATPRLLLARGNTCYPNDDHERAAELYRQALELKQGWSAAQKNLALAYEALGRDGDATDIWLQLLDEPRMGDQARWQLVLLNPDPGRLQETDRNAAADQGCL